MNKLNLASLRSLPALLLLSMLTVFFIPLNSYAQLKEPPVRDTGKPLTPLSQGLENRIGVTLVLNNFGFGVSGTYAWAVAPFTEVTFTAGITGIRNVSAQEFIFFRTGRKVVPNRYRRALGFPLMAGIERRLFPYAIADDFRFFISIDGGPAFAYTYPYFDDKLTAGYRDFVKIKRRINNRFFVITRPVEEINSFFDGLGNGDWHFGFAGSLSIGVDIGDDFENQFTFEIGYFFYYFPDGLQLMEPYKNTKFIEAEPIFGQPCNFNKGSIICVTSGKKPFYEEQSYFGTPQIKLTYSWWF